MLKGITPKSWMTSNSTREAALKLIALLLSLIERIVSDIGLEALKSLMSIASSLTRSLMVFNKASGEPWSLRAISSVH